mmetsp:Transcript_23641/g.44150  ORF Transcript_23641/g.44150 Transcript_23641/m.44150 type:complete len:175 (-) Transcript_23641:149-673(-)
MGGIEKAGARRTQLRYGSQMSQCLCPSYILFTLPFPSDDISVDVWRLLQIVSFDDQWKSPLHLMIARGASLRAVKNLMDCYLQIPHATWGGKNVQEDLVQTPLHALVEARYSHAPKIAKLILSRWPEAAMMQYNGMTALQKAQRSSRTSPEMLGLLLEYAPRRGQVPTCTCMVM